MEYGIVEYGVAIGTAIYLPLVIVCGWVASEKNRTFFGHLLFAALFTPAFWMLVLIALPPLTSRRLAGERVEPTM